MKVVSPANISVRMFEPIDRKRKKRSSVASKPPVSAIFAFFARLLTRVTPKFGDFPPRYPDAMSQKRAHDPS